MTKQEFSKVAAAMRTYYPNSNLLPNTIAVELWYNQLCDISYQVMTLSLNEWVAVNKWPPTIADLRESATRITQSETPDWATAYEHARSVVRKYGYYNYEDAMQNLEGIEKETVKAIGYTDWCKSENPAVIRAHFRDIYTTLAERKKREAQLPPGIKNALLAVRNGIGLMDKAGGAGDE